MFSLLLLADGRTARAQTRGLIRVAVAPAAGPASAGPAELTQGVASGLNEVGVLAVAGRRYRARAKAVGRTTTDPAVARAVGARYLVTVRVERSPKAYIVTARLVDVDGRGQGRIAKRIRGRYRRGQNARRVGVRIGRRFAAFIVEGRSTAAKDGVAEAQRDRREDRQARRSAPSSEVSREAQVMPSVSEAKRTRSPASGRGPVAPQRSEDRRFRLRVGFGSQVGSSYAVSVDGAATGLDYVLAPSPRFEADVTYFLPSLGFGARVEVGVSFVSYEIDVTPPVEPDEPTGTFIGIGGHVFYPIEVATFGKARLSLVPLVGAGYDTFSVDSQGANSVILSYGGLDVLAGLRSQLSVTETFTVELDVRGGALLGYREEPTTTGADGLGFSVYAGASIRYWLWSSVGVSGDLSYRFQQVELSGAGTRVTFDDDPIIEDASVANRVLRISAGAVLAF